MNIYRKKKLHQKLVMSKMNAKKAAKLDMDDRAKILQYFSKPVGHAGDMAGNCNYEHNFVQKLMIYIIIIENVIVAS